MTILTDDLLYSAPVAITPQAAMMVESLIIEMQFQGYECGAKHYEVGQLDSEIVGRMKCRQCGGGLHYEPFHKAGSYKPFTICVDCGNVKEF